MVNVENMLSEVSVENFEFQIRDIYGIHEFLSLNKCSIRKKESRYISIQFCIPSEN